LKLVEPPVASNRTSLFDLVIILPKLLLLLLIPSLFEKQNAVRAPCHQNFAFVEDHFTQIKVGDLLQVEAAYVGRIYR